MRLFHNGSAVILDGALTDVQIGRNIFASRSNKHQFHYLMLSGCKLRYDLHGLIAPGEERL
jgi:hypothetical protein